MRYLKQSSLEKLKVGWSLAGSVQKWKEELSNGYKAPVTKINSDHLNTILKILEQTLGNVFSLLTQKGSREKIWKDRHVINLIIMMGFIYTHINVIKATKLYIVNIQIFSETNFTSIKLSKKERRKYTYQKIKYKRLKLIKTKWKALLKHCEIRNLQICH